MIRKVIQTINGPLPVEIPTELREVTLGMLIDLRNDNSDIEAIAILSGVPLDRLYDAKSTDEFDQFTDYVLSLSHKLKYDYDKVAHRVPKNVTIAGKTVDVINNLSIEPVGAFMECRDLIAEEINHHIQAFGEEDWKTYYKPDLDNAALILAHYFYCKVTGQPYDAFKAEEFKSEVVKLPITESLPIARDFFLNYPNLLRQKLSFWQAIKHLWKNKQASRRLKRSRTTTL